MQRKIKSKKQGFTLPELTVVLTILAIILAIGIPTAIHYIKLAEFRKNEENAKTIYMGAESALTWYRSSGQWEEFKEKVIAQGKKNTSFTDDRKDRIYAITLEKGAYQTSSADSDPVLELMDGLTYAKDMLTDGAVAIEIDVESGQVYSAFYGTRCKRLAYGTNDADGMRDMNDRAYSSRRKRFLGYYSVEDITNVVDLEPVRLKVSSINLINGETLSLNWSGNSRHDNLDLEYYVKFYDKNSGKELFQLTVDRAKAISQGWDGSAAGSNSLTVLPLTTQDGTKIEGYNFPLTYDNGTFSLVLDGMMSADALAALEKPALSETEKKELQKSSDMSITRLSALKDKIGVDLSSPHDIYATVQAVSTYQNMAGDNSEYRQSAAVTSNTSNTMYADDTKVKVEGGSKTLEAGIAAFRHLSNIRYYDGSSVPAKFAMTAKEMDWNSSGTGVYDYVEKNGINKLAWKGNDGSLEFPSVPELSKTASLSGGKQKGRISNLRLGTKSVINDKMADKLGIAKSKYVGLFCEVSGKVSDLTFYNPSMIMAEVTETSENSENAVQTANSENSEDAENSEEAGDTIKEVKDAKDFDSICGVGILAGKTTGSLTDIKISVDDSERKILTVSLADRTPEGVGAAETAGAGGIAGVVVSTGSTKLSGLSVSGAVTAKLPDPGTAEDEGEGTGESTVENKADTFSYGVGGLFGYASLTSGVQITDCVNHGDVSGNLFAGGIVGNVDGSFNIEEFSKVLDVNKNLSNIADCENDGLILCTSGHETDENTIEGRYFGGIVGYAHKTLIYETKSASGRASGFVYSLENKSLLKGQYVGGILGFGKDCLLLSCSTQNKGYILGSDYVGGIVGGLTEETGTISRIGGGIAVTTNAGYVIGNTYVGGIIGKNEGNNTLENCVNNGVAAGYKKYIGGIAGYNGDHATIKNSVSYISDHSGKIFETISNTWETTGDYAGGIAGYNNGSIEFEKDVSQVTVKSVSGIVVGRDYVGGIIGFNDTKGKLNVDYILIGGRIYAYGDCAGGCIGFNASSEILGEEIEVRPNTVRGTYCVGGCIGANVVDLSSDIEMGGFHTGNPLGKLTAKAFAGGVIGYQRTYSADSLGLEVGDEIVSYMEENKNKLLPQLDGENLPTQVEKSENPHKMTLTDNRNHETALTSASNFLALRAEMYVGGILGYCESESGLVIKNCWNAGHISGNTGQEFADTTDGVSVIRYLEFTDCPSSEVDPAIKTDMAGGIIGANFKNQVIDHCSNTGSLSGFTCLGGIVGFNGGGIFNCELSGNFGNASQDYVGGIAGLNIKTSENTLSYKDILGKEWDGYIPGTVASCKVKQGVTVTGKNTVGGIVAFNLPGGVVENDLCLGNVTAAANDVGGIVGRNGGTVQVAEDSYKNISRTVSGRSGEGIGGLVGCNEENGLILVAGTGEVTAVSNGVTVVGGKNVGGLIGVNHGQFAAENNGTLVCRAENVRALKGNAGGIAGVSTNDIRGVKNASAQVAADTGFAGGIVSSNSAGMTIADCDSVGNVNSNYGEAGGITAQNGGTIFNCTVKGEEKDITIRSRSTEQAGAVCAINLAGAVIEKSAPGDKVILNSNCKVYGGVTGINQGTVTDSEISHMPKINAQGVSGLTVGGAAGVNENKIEKIIASEAFENFSGYHYLGGVAGENEDGAKITDSSYGGRMTESASTAGNCYGGIAGINKGTVFSCSAQSITMNIKGTYTATGTSTADQKEAMSSHTGGIVGKNEEDAAVDSCYLDAANSKITAGSGMVGGVAGYNKGMITKCGDESTVAVISQYGEHAGANNFNALCEQIKDAADTRFVQWNNSANIENLLYNNSNQTVSKGKTQIIMSAKGSLGGVTAYNAPTGELSYCATGQWFLNNKSDDISVGTGGMIGMNESEKDMIYLVNNAFVGRQLASANTNRFAGGIIGNQNNSTTQGWTLSHCINTGTVYCYKSHYAGGIIGQWTGSGGNIENCRNYGMLQTTYSTDWVGASAGIVAQLYHANEGNEYNIISCGNFGSIYGREGGSHNNCANDSAGILGNVTAYFSKNEAAAQNYTIQVLDCVNGPGVEIYSASMASGIVGFFSSDNPNAGNISNSTANITLRIERCRNFSKKLDGVQFDAGIFGDRYGNTGTKKTTLNDCYSVSLGTNYTDGSNRVRNNPIVSLTSPGSSKPEALTDAADNYFFDGSNGSSYQTAFSLAEGRANAGNSTGTIGTAAYQTADNLKRASSLRAYLMYNQTSGRYFAVSLLDAALNNQNNISAKNCYIDPSDGCIYRITDQNNTASDVKIAKILFELPAGAANYTTTNSLTQSGSIFYTYVRDAWRVREGAVLTTASGKKKLQAPKSVTSTLTNGKINVTVTPDNNIDPWAETGSKCDPFKYEVAVVVGGKIVSTEYIYSETGIVSVPESSGGEVSVQVRAVSMYDDVEPSDYTKASGMEGKVVLPEPKLRAELVWKNNRGGYEISLTNLEKYNELAGDNWRVTVEISGQKVTLTKSNPTAIVQGNENTQQIVAQATSTGSNYMDSSKTSVAVFMPASYFPDTPIIKWDGNNQPEAKPKIQVSGSTLEDLSVTVSLTHSGRIPNTPPVYRVDFIGTWRKGTTQERENVVFASKDILVAALNTVSVTFADLPEYIKDASDFKVRIWYAETGLGPVYTYHELKNETGANYFMMTGLQNNGPVYQWMYSEALENHIVNIYRYRYLSDYNIFTWLPAPVLSGVEGGDGGELSPQYDSDGNLQYVFYWDEGEAFDENAKYEFTLTGIDETDNRVLVDTSACELEKVTLENGNRVWSLTVPAEEWNFTKAELSVTRVGNEAEHEIGLTSVGSYKVRQRLKTPQQPEITIDNEDELNYTATWVPISPETGCGSYQLYAQVYEEEQAAYGTPIPMGSPLEPGEEQDGIFYRTLNLEDYAGKQMRFYVVAKAEENSADYVDSAPGITYDLTVPNRIAAPSVTWQTSWSYDRANPLTMDSFLSGGLNVMLTANDTDSIPPAGSAYLMRAYIYDTEEAAKNAISVADSEDLSTVDGYLAGYDEEEGIVKPVEMDKAGASDSEYQHIMEGISADYAGKWVVLQARISSGSGNVSSRWVTAIDPLRLPYVKLDEADVQSGIVNKPISVEVSENPDLPPEIADWNASQTEFYWNSGEYAQISYVDITEIAKDQTEVEHRFRIEKVETGDKTPELNVSEWIDDGSGSGHWQEVRRTIPVKEDTMTDTEYEELLKRQYSYTFLGNPDETEDQKKGYHRLLEGIFTKDEFSSYFKMETAAVLNAELLDDGTFRYTLTLPDISSIEDDTGYTIPGGKWEFSSKITFQMDVTANEAENEEDKSPSYVGSDLKTVELN